MQHACTVIIAALPLITSTAIARAQLKGIPVYCDANGGTGVSFAADVGFPSYNAGGGTAYGAAGSIGTGRLTVTGMAGVWSVSSSSQTWVGGTVAYRLVGGELRLVTVAVQAGYGATTSAAPAFAATLIPVGVSVAFKPPLFPLKPWIAPRMEFTRAEGSTGQFRFSSGVNLDLARGLALHAAVDWGFGGSAWTRGAIWGVGAHFHFHGPTA